MKMRKRFCFVMCLLLTGTLSAQISYFEWQQEQRQYIIKTPTGCDRNVPIVFFLHGLGDNITRLDNEYHFQQLADRYQWIMVAPQALNGGIGNMWNAGLGNGSVDDAGFLMALYDTLAAHYPVDTDSLFFTGFSMGGFMSHRMAIEHGDRINACAPVSGLISHEMANQTASVPVKMLHIHGTADPVVGYDGNSQYFGNLGLGVASVIDYWKGVNHCSGDPTIDTLPDLRNDGLRFVRYTYVGDAPLQHIKVIGGVHTWYVNDNRYDIDYFDVIHQFFTEGSSVAIDRPALANLQLWPNPTADKVCVSTDAATWLIVVNTQGRIVAEYQVEQGISTLSLSHLPEGIYFVKDRLRGGVARCVVRR